MLTKREVSGLKLQRLLSAACFYPLYFTVLALARLRGYRFADIGTFQREVWKKLDAHDGPVIWAANHLTLIDSFLVFLAVFPLRKTIHMRRAPWSTPEYQNYYHLGHSMKKNLIRATMYLCRCIPFLRQGDDAASELWRQKVFEKCIWLLKNGQTVFVYPEAGRSRSGWLEKKRPKDFLGRLALEAPRAKFLCVYLRGEEQICTTAMPKRGEIFRMEAELIPAALEGETTPRAVSKRLFETLSALQDRWFSKSRMARNCAGNDVVDLKSPRIMEHFDEESGEMDPDWIARHLTPKEIKQLNAIDAGSRRLMAAWKIFSAKEAAGKAFEQGGIHTPSGGFLMISVDLFRGKAEHRPTGAQTDIVFTHEDQDKIHCVSILRGGYIGDDETPGDFLCDIFEAPAGENPSDFAREKCLEFIARSSDEIPSPGVLTVADDGGIPKILRNGRTQDWGVSLSHSGRFAACSLMTS
ncbi:MAG: 1-acyl-sn-glycerol-3-phosphate acyltransferase [Elusimicrobiota bacterium]